MDSELMNVETFMLKAEQDCPPTITLPDIELRINRLRYLAEELAELATAWGIEMMMDNLGSAIHPYRFSAREKAGPPRKIVDVITAAYDADLDSIYFHLGNMVAMGIPSAQVGWNRVHASNLSKFIDGHKDPTTGKWMKGPSYKAPDLKSLIEEWYGKTYGRV